MRLEDHIANLQKVLKEHGNLNVIYAIDEEGNDYNYVEFKPTVGCYSNDDGEFMCEAEIEAEDNGVIINAVVIN